jgi:colicin import membrane protein
MPGEGTRRPPPPPFNPDEVREWLKANEPETWLRLSGAELGGHTEESRRILGDAAGRMRDLAELKQRDPGAYEKLQEMHRLEREGAALAEQARRAPAEEKEAASKKLKENLARQFDLREEQRLREIAELKRRVESLEKAIGERRANKDRIVDKRRRELLGERVDEDW